MTVENGCAGSENLGVGAEGEQVKIQLESMGRI